MYPVWDVKFAPIGYYFATSSHDKTARLWATDQYQPLRIFGGHFSDVDVRIISKIFTIEFVLKYNLFQCIEFHPNSNYVATGSSDRTVCLWDISSGNHVRVMTGHKVIPLYYNTGRCLRIYVYYLTLFRARYSR